MGVQACAVHTGLFRCSALLPQVSEGDEARADEEDPLVGQTKLQEPEDNEIRTVHAGDTPYTSAASFEDLPISGMLLQVDFREHCAGARCLRASRFMLRSGPVCKVLAVPAAGAVHRDEV